MKWSSFEEQLGSWAPKIKPFFDRGGFDQIYEKLKDDARRGKVILPSSNFTFRVFKEVEYDNLKSVWLLQDPYYQVKNGVTIASGVAMDCRNTSVLQPSLQLFYDGMEEDLYKGLNLNLDRNPSLEYLGRQGIMMLNTALTVEKDKPSSHKDLWHDFTKFLMEEVFNANTGLVFVMCGKQSQYYSRYLNPLQHYIFEVEHMAAAAHQMRKWKHENVFSKSNKIFRENNNYSVIWDYGELPF